MARPTVDQSESGIMVYPKLPLPKRESHPGMPPRRSAVNKIVIGAIGGALLGGVVVGMLLRPMVAPDPRIATAEEKAGASDKAAATAKTRADGLEKDVEKLTAAKKELADRLASVEKVQTDSAAVTDKRSKDLEAAKAKVAAAKSGASVSVDGDQLRVLISDSALFPMNSDALTENGKKLLAKLAPPLKELREMTIAVQGHTDDRPVPVVARKAPPPPPPPKKGQKPAPPAPVAAPEPPRIPTNWELSALRAIAVVHYLQDVSKVDASRISAEAFGQYRPISRSNKAANRRIEIVLQAKPKK